MLFDAVTWKYGEASKILMFFFFLEIVILMIPIIHNLRMVADTFHIPKYLLKSHSAETCPN